jgi:hypothetical protein
MHKGHDDMAVQCGLHRCRVIPSHNTAAANRPRHLGIYNQNLPYVIVSPGKRMKLF